LAAIGLVGGVFGANLGAQQPAAAGAPSAGGSTAAAASPAALAVLQRASARYRASSAMCADFAQQLTVPLLNQKSSSKGQICLKTPGLLAMNFSQPSGDRIIVDGTYLWTYLRSQNPKTVFQTPAATGSALDFRREFLDNPEAKYNVSLMGKETIDGKPSDKVMLRPKQRSQYRDAVLWIGADSIVRRFQYSEENGNVKVLSLSNINLRANPAADMFRFNPPAGVNVVKQP
jgi:chaperone LolA